jgi:hypothetical protein
MVTCKKTLRGGESYATRKNVLGTMLSAVTARSTPSAPEFPGTINHIPGVMNLQAPLRNKQNNT